MFSSHSGSSFLAAESCLFRISARFFLAVITAYPLDMHLSEGCALAAAVFWIPLVAGGSAQV
ncbi:hypothetical protein DW757_00335 [Clostridium sp. AM29-11AC]|nr:hypothetical protein DW757_00335 [Clostridium sp. AM29-11AC]